VINKKRFRRYTTSRGRMALKTKNLKIFVSIIWFRQTFLSTTKFGGTKKIWGQLSPNISGGLQAWAERSPESLPLRAFMF